MSNLGNSDSTVVEVTKDGMGHAFDESRTQAYIMSYADAGGASKEIFFSVSDPLWADDGNAAHPKGTIVLFHGPNEFSELYTDQIHKFTDEGYRVVAFDMPGSGRSSRDAQVGSENLLHVDSVDECADAARKVVSFVANNEDYTINPGGFHFVTSSLGNVVALEALKDLPASSVESITCINPVFDMDLVGTLDTRIILPFIGDKESLFTADKDSYANTTQKVIALTGEHLQTLRDRFNTHNGAKPALWTRSYVNSFAESVDAIDAKPKAIQQVLTRNDIPLSIMYDSNIDGLFDADHTEEWTRWAKSRGVTTTLTTMDGEGPDLLFNPDRRDEVYSAIESNARRGSLYVDVIDKLKTIHRVEWNQMSEAERKSMQDCLQSKGYDVGPTGIDGTPRYGGVAFTEHAIAEFLIDLDKAQKLMDENGVADKPLASFKDQDFKAENIKRIIESTDFKKQPPPVPAQAVSSPALISQF